MQVLSVSKIIVNQLITLCEDLTLDQYSASLNLLMNNSIGKHIRHIAEFYDLLKISYRENSVLSYDKRYHCDKIETDNILAVDRLKNILNWFNKIDNDVILKLNVSCKQTQEEGFEINTSLERELEYNVEHAIHHMAIIRIAIEWEFTDVKLDRHFGVAFSTIRFRDDLCVH